MLLYLYNNNINIKKEKEKKDGNTAADPAADNNA